MPLLARAWPVTSAGRFGNQNSACSLKSPKVCLVRRSPPSTSAEPPETGHVGAEPSAFWKAPRAPPSNRVTRLVPLCVHFCWVTLPGVQIWSWVPSALEPPAASSTLPDCGLSSDPSAWPCHTCAALLLQV